jgi:anti-sigma factor RsiW
MTLAHPRFRELAAREVDASLPPDEQRELERHLAACEACRALVAGLRADAAALAVPYRPQVPVHVQRRLEQAVVNPPLDPGLMRLLTIVAVVLVVTVVLTVLIVLGAILFRDDGGTPTQTEPATAARLER